MGSIKTYVDTGDIYLQPLDYNDRNLVLTRKRYDVDNVESLKYALSITDVVDGDYSPMLAIFTSSNKPSGSYIGDGIIGRTFELSNRAYGYVMIITCEANNTCVIVTHNGSFVCDEGGVNYVLPTESVFFIGNSFTIYKTTGAFNYPGDTYEYFVL